MKPFIQRINRTLLEKFPLIWNTRLLWVLAITLITHIFFFLLGSNVFTNKIMLQQYYADKIYVYNGILLFSIICSVLIIVIWLIILFRNNSFKNYYPTSRWQLFFSFVIYFITFLSVTTFYTSYIFGYKIYISKQYPDKKLESMIASSNLAGAFLSFNQADYIIANKKYPSPFDTLYCETEEDQINFDKPYLQRFNDEYQFYTIIKRSVSSTDNKSIIKARTNSIYQRYVSDTVTMFAYRGEVVDISSLANVELSYYNYSRVLFDNYYYAGSARYYSEDIDQVTYNNFENTRSRKINKSIYTLLKRNDPNELKGLLTSFLKIAGEFDIETNLTADKWLALINTKDYNVEKFITNGVMSLNNASSEAEDEVVTAIEEKDLRNTPENRNKKDQFYKDRKTDYYFDTESLQTVFANIKSIQDYNHWNVMFHMQYWLAFGLSILLLMYRTTGLPALLFSLITSFVISILISLVVMSLQIFNELNIAYLVFLVGTTILLLPLFFLKKIKKQIQSVFINITLAGVIPYILLILFIIQLHQKAYYYKIYGEDYYKHQPELVFDYFGESLSYLLLIVGFIFVLLYTDIIKKWKALPEG